MYITVLLCSYSCIWEAASCSDLTLVIPPISPFGSSPVPVFVLRASALISTALAAKKLEAVQLVLAVITKLL